MKKRMMVSLLLCLCMMISLLPAGAFAAKRNKEPKPEPVFQHHEFEHHYQLQPDSYEATDTEGGYRHYVCKDCGDEYSYTMDPLVYETNPKTGEPVTQAGAWNPLLPTWEHIPDGEPQVYWSKADNEWRCYLYGSHDDTGIGSCGFNYLLYSAPVYDLSDWRYEGVYLDISEHATSGATVGLFAPDCAYDVNTDLYYMISNEFNAYSVLRVADNPCGPWAEEEGEWKISVKAAYDPSIYIDKDGTIFIAGSCMKTVYNTYPEVEAAVAADDYKSGMSHIGVLYQLKQDLSDGDGIEAISWMPNDARSYLPIYEGPSLQGWVDELGVYVYFYVSYDVGMDGSWYNSCLGWLWMDDMMNGTWHFGENAVEEFYPELDYVISGNHGNIVSDTSGRYVRDPETGEMVFTDFPVYAYGNNHGGLAKINGKWIFFGHRQTNRTSFSRHAVAGEVQVYLDGDVPVITPFEYTSSGIAGSIPAYTVIDADRTVYLIPAWDHPAPSSENNNIHTDCRDVDPYIVATRDETAVHATYIAELRNGNIAGFKYLDFGEEALPTSVSLLVSPAETDGEVAVWIDAPTEAQGGKQIGSVTLSAEAYEAASEKEEGVEGMVWSWIGSELDEPVTGLHGVYFVFSSDADGIICSFDQFAFSNTAA